MSEGIICCPLGSLAYQRILAADPPARIANRARLRDLKFTCTSDLTIVCSHDRKELEDLQR
jgi:hypothetical protein